MGAEIVQLQSGGEKLLLDGQSFYHRLRRNNRKYWKCSVKRCTATAVTNNADGLLQVEKETPHNHKVEHRDEYDSEGHDSSGSLDHDVEEEATREPLDFSSDESDDENDSAEATEESDDSERADVLWMEWVEESSDDETSDEDADHDSDQKMSSDDEANGEVETDGEDAYTKMDTDEDSETDTTADDSDSTDDEEDEFDRSIRILSDHEKMFGEKIYLLRKPEKYLRSAVLKNASKGLICFLNEICLNIRRGYFPLSKYNLNIIKMYEDQVKAMSNINVSWKMKKVYLTEHDDEAFIPVILNSLAESHSFCSY